MFLYFLYLKRNKCIVDGLQERLCFHRFVVAWLHLLHLAVAYIKWKRLIRFDKASSPSILKKWLYRQVEEYHLYETSHQSILEFIHMDIIYCPSLRNFHTYTILVQKDEANIEERILTVSSRWYHNTFCLSRECSQRYNLILLLIFKE